MAAPPNLDGQIPGAKIEERPEVGQGKWKTPPGCGSSDELAHRREAVMECIKKGPRRHRSTVATNSPRRVYFFGATFSLTVLDLQ